MYQDYQNEKQKYNGVELFPVQRVQPYRSRLVQQATRRQIPQQKKNKKNKNPRTSQYRNQMKKQFDAFNKKGNALHSNASGLLDQMSKLVVPITLIALAAMGLTKYLDIQATKFSSEYAPDGGSGMSTGKLSAKGKQFIANEEGLKTEAYQDSKGVWTIGVGHTGSVDGKKVGPGMVITKEKAMELFEKDVEKFENYVNRVVKVPVSQNMFDAMVSYAFNVGSLGPKFLQKLNSGDYRGAMAELTTVNAELQGRRSREQALFGSDITSDNKLASDPINNPTVRQTSAGKIRQFANGTQIGGYTMANPAEQRKYIELSERAEAYLRDVGGTGLITSGAEGSHADGAISHKSGNKIDVVARGTSLEAWADTAIPFARNKNTAYINFEFFTPQEFARVKEIIYSKDPSLRQIGESMNRGGRNCMGGAKFFCSTLGKHSSGKHLDIGILPDAYSKKNPGVPETETPTKTTPNNKPVQAKTQQPTTQNNNIQKQLPKPQPQPTKQPTSQQTNIKSGGNTQKSKQDTTSLDKIKPSPKRSNGKKS